MSVTRRPKKNRAAAITWKVRQLHRWEQLETVSPGAAEVACPGGHAEPLRFQSSLL